MILNELCNAITLNSLYKIIKREVTNFILILIHISSSPNKKKQILRVFSINL